ncbi:MAG: Fe-S cluster assembly protein SufB, partial [Lachnospiraceae bacterium]|nr:Fe-S cluster assembly protein SufB [Lachnospiraceae bacterium]
MPDEKQALREQDSQSMYDFKNEENTEDFFREEEGFTEDIILRISAEKKEPDWMRDFRLKCLKLYEETNMVDWGPDIDGLDMDRIASYVRHKEDMKNDWNEVPPEIKNT